MFSVAIINHNCNKSIPSNRFIFHQFIFLNILFSVCGCNTQLQNIFKLRISLSRNVFSRDLENSFATLFCNIYMYTCMIYNCSVSDSKTVLLHVDDGSLSMQSGTLHAERIGYLLGCHSYGDVDREVRLLFVSDQLCCYV